LTTSRIGWNSTRSRVSRELPYSIALTAPLYHVVCCSTTSSPPRFVSFWITERVPVRYRSIGPICLHCFSCAVLPLRLLKGRLGSRAGIAASEIRDPVTLGSPAAFASLRSNGAARAPPLHEPFDARFFRGYGRLLMTTDTPRRRTQKRARQRITQPVQLIKATRRFRVA